MSVMHKVHISRILGDSTVEIKFIQAWNHTGEQACLGAVAVLGIVDGFLEGDGHACSGEVIGQAYRKSN